MTNTDRPAAVIFDLGGVIVMLGPLSDLLGSYAPPAEDFWPRWLHSEAVRAYEGGYCTTDEFADALTSEFSLPFGPEELLRRFAAWPKGLYPGATQLLEELSEQNPALTVGALSNSNPLHWSEQNDAEQIRALFDTPFLSFEMKLLKPDPAIYRHVERALGLEPPEILYFDDNQINVDGAINAGWRAHVARHPDECRRYLATYRLVATLKA
ncbi:MAG: HAD family phosphatase [Acidimicrobiales bacterium]|nr:HAD family phosphatase [Acidimicrobiales bacterium]